MLMQKMQGNLVLCYVKTIDNGYSKTMWILIIPQIVLSWEGENPIRRENPASQLFSVSFLLS